jgi:hypothetical protein
MSGEADDQVRGPAMLAATNMLKPPPPVIGSVNKEITLPRTVKLTTLAAVGAGALSGFVIAVFLFGAGVKALMYGPTLGAGLGWAALNFSPMQGESMARWLGLRASSARKRKLVVDGRPVLLYVGIAPLRRTAAGTIRMVPGGVPVEAVRWDERGFPRQEIPGAARLTSPRRRPRQLTASTRLSSHGVADARRGGARRG